jgi:hypothetical protein
MTIERVRELYDAQPFRPFVLHLPAGRHVRVEHREFMASAPSGRTVVVYQSDDSLNIIDLLLVTEVAIKGNGRNSKKK